MLIVSMFSTFLILSARQIKEFYLNVKKDYKSRNILEITHGRRLRTFNSLLRPGIESKADTKRDDSLSPTFFPFLQESPRETFKDWLAHHAKAYQEGMEVCCLAVSMLLALNQHCLAHSSCTAPSPHLADLHFG